METLSADLPVPHFRLPLLVALFSFLILSLPSGAGAQGTGGINTADAQEKPYLILVSFDGFRWDYQSHYSTPALDRIERDGVKADALIPVYPTLTFPNHYSIATGLYPARHGIVGNNFYNEERSRFYQLGDREQVEDGSWYGGTPIWVAAEKSGMVSAAFFFVGTEADIGGIRPSHWRSFNPNIRGTERVDQVLDWLALPDAQRPHMITLYFEDVDTYSHSDGVGTPRMISAVERVDSYLERLLDGIEESPLADKVTVIVVSDHGQTNYRGFAPFVVDDVVDLDGVHAVDHGSAAFLYFEQPDPVRAAAIAATINARWGRGQAVVPGDAPESWHLTTNSRFADVIVQADPEALVASSRDSMPEPSRGDHGWAPETKEMHGIFYAIGPRLPAGQRVPAIEVVDVYPLMLEILGLPMAEGIDGNAERLVPLLDRQGQ